MWASAGTGRLKPRPGALRHQGVRLRRLGRGPGAARGRERSRLPAGAGGKGLGLSDTGVAEQDRIETTAGRVSVLLALKVTVDLGVDLRGRDPRRTWDQSYADS